MKVIGLLPVRNEAWVLRHTLACLSGFCDVILVQDQDSEDESRAICLQFPKVELLTSATPRICEQARWQLLDVSRDFDGHNLLWMTDADELVSPSLVRRSLEGVIPSLRTGATLDLLWYQLWNYTKMYRNDLTLYRPSWKSVAFVDDRKSDYDRTGSLPLHRSRVPQSPTGQSHRMSPPLLHLQWLLPKRNQMKQAWYRCKELLEGDKTAAEINASYSITLPRRAVKTSPVLDEWVRDITFPGFEIDSTLSWHETEILQWFDRYGVERFEPLEIWHLRRLREEFQRRIGCRPRPDRSYRPPWTVRVRRSARRVVRALETRLNSEP